APYRAKDKAVEAWQPGAKKPLATSERPTGRAISACSKRISKPRDAPRKVHVVYPTAPQPESVRALVLFMVHPPGAVAVGCSTCTSFAGVSMISWQMFFNSLSS